MKKILITLAVVGLAASSFAQGTVAFGNSGTTALRYTSDAAQAGAGLAGLKLFPGTSFIVGLYVGASGANEGALTLVKTTTIAASATASTSALAGVFSGGNPLDVGRPDNAPANFMIKAWSAGFASYEAALLNPTLTTYAGKSALSTVTLGGGGTPAAIIISATGVAPGTVGTGPVAPFTVALVPEPASASIIGLGLASLLIFRRRK